ncbi:MAG: succinate dehydrogenase cytochrome b subunit [Bacteroidales bacterium]|nr:succinate dehydrogenase cytochrome b subunit [Bacteroidales bacterium]
MIKSGLSISSITKKIIMALLGLFLIVFLLVHLGINLFILPICEDHAEMYTAAAHFMSTNWIVKVFEVILMAAFLIHIYYGIVLQIQNWIARGSIRYKSRNKTTTSFMSKYVIYTGLLIFMFLLLHFYNFYFIKLGLVSAPKAAKIPLPQEEHFYELIVWLFTNDMIFSIIYIIAFIVLGIHLKHAFEAAFQTLGLNHSKYTPVINAIGTIYSIVVPLGFIIIPVYFILFI